MYGTDCHILEGSKNTESGVCCAVWFRWAALNLVGGGRKGAGKQGVRGPPLTSIPHWRLACWCATWLAALCHEVGP